MATASARAPRGTKILTQAFFSAAGEVPEAQRAAVVKAALAAIRDELKTARDKAAAAKAKAKGKSAGAAPAKKMGRPVGVKSKAPVALKATKVAAKPVKAKKAAPAEESQTTAKAKKVAPAEATKKAAPKAARQPTPVEAPSQDAAMPQAAE